MPRVVFSSTLQRYTDGQAAVQVTSLDYRALLKELRAQFPEIPEALLRKQALAIDGQVVHEPLLQRFRDDSELVFVPKIAGG